MAKVKRGGQSVKNDIKGVVDKSLKNNEPFYTIVYKILGGRIFLSKAPASSIDYVTASLNGIPKQSLVNIAQVLGIPMKDIAGLLNISYKTLGRKGKKDLMNPLESSLSVELANVAAKGIFVFEDFDKFGKWLQKENKALGSKKPIQLLNTPTGIKLVSEVLGRIEEGIYT